jgi:molybdenum cofactor cytidylyltransferase
MSAIHAIIPAAGDSRRYGSPKQLLPWNGGTLLQHAVGQARAACEAVTVVLGARADLIQPTLAGRDTTVVFNPDWHEGLAASIRAGVAALPDDAGAALFVLCDQPLVGHATLSALAGRWRQRPDAIVAAYYNATHGVPAVFPRSLFGELLELKGDRGARPLFNKYSTRLESVPAPQAGIDIDTPADLNALLAEHEKTGVSI